MATKIVTKNSSTASSVPTAAQLVQGELAVNVADKRLYTEDNAGAIVELGTNPSTLTVTGEITANGGIALGDNDKATFGAGDDLQIYHDPSGPASYISDVGNGDLIIKGSNQIRLQQADGDALATFNEDGSVQLYYDNSEKLATTAIGISVTGSVVADGLTVDGAATIQDATSPSLRFLDTNAANSDFTIYSPDGSNDLRIKAGSGQEDAFEISSSGDVSFYENTGSTPKMVWDASAESLGIGTSSPSAKVDVAGVGNFNTAFNAFAGDGLHIQCTGTAGNGNYAGGISFSRISDDNNSRAAGISAVQDNDDIDRLGLAFFIHDSGSTGSDLVEAVRISSAGSVGIGTSDPSTYGVDGADDLVIGQADGNHGLTISSFGSSNGTIAFSDQTDVAVGRGYLDYDHSVNAMTVGTNGTERMRIDDSGNVGIGTDSPYATSKLTLVPATNPTTASSGDVQLSIGESTGNSGYSLKVGYINNGSGFNGSIQAIKNGAASPLLLNADGGNVGIGASSPDTTLHVVGSGVAEMRFGAIGTSNNSALRISRSDGAIGVDNPLGYLEFGGRDTTGGVDIAHAYVGAIATHTHSAGDNGTALIFGTTANNSETIVERMRIGDSGDVDVVGALSKGSGSFKIDHPLPAKTETHNLVHSFIEGPQADNIYRGKVTLAAGSASVNIDDAAGMTGGTYVLLNTNTQCFTSNETGWTAVKGSVSENILTIEAQESCSDTISWMVVGERHDQHMLDTAWTDEIGKVIVEPLKPTKTGE
jgi:hypothetical protein